MWVQIEIDTLQLRDSTASLRETIAELQAQIGLTSDTLTELDSMWDGPANRAFMAGYEKNRALFNDFCADLEALANALEYAAKAYESCEGQVEELVASIHI